MSNLFKLLKRASVPAVAVGTLQSEDAEAAIPFFHASPKLFDRMKIGADRVNGAVYGHGAYGADKSRVATEYRDWDVAAAVDDKLFSAQRRGNLDDIDIWTMAGDGMTPDEIAAKGYSGEALDEFRDMYQSAPGAMYEGEYRWADPLKEEATPLTGNDLLDWESSIKKHPNPRVRKTLLGMAEEPNMRGGDLYDQLAQELGQGDYNLGMRLASEKLNEAGVPGIRYGLKDQMNTVMFDENGIVLNKRNGLPIAGGLLGLGAAGGASASEMPPEAPVSRSEARLEPTPDPTMADLENALQSVTGAYNAVREDPLLIPEFMKILGQGAWDSLEESGNRTIPQRAQGLAGGLLGGVLDTLALAEGYMPGAILQRALGGRSAFDTPDTALSRAADSVNEWANEGDPASAFVGMLMMPGGFVKRGGGKAVKAGDEFYRNAHKAFSRGLLE